MDYKVTSIASQEVVRAAHKAGAKLILSCHPDETVKDGWRLQIVFRHEDETWSYLGRLFRAPNKIAAESRTKQQLARLLGQQGRTALKLSPEYCAARDALQIRAQEVWQETGGSGDNLIVPGPIKVDWNERTPRLKVARFTGMDGLRGRYNPHLAKFEEAFRQEGIRNLRGVIEPHRRNNPQASS